MTSALEAWREAFLARPKEEFDRLMRGRVLLGAATQLSLGELLDRMFDAGDTTLDTAIVSWLRLYMLQGIPEGMHSSRWAVLLDELFRGIATMRLTQTGELIRDEHARIRLWLRGLCEGPQRDPEGSYLIALAYYQSDQRYSSLWRRLVLGRELPGRAYRDIGLLGLRKMPDATGQPAADVPEGLLHAVVELAGSAIPREDWQRTVRATFAAYRSSAEYWTARFCGTIAAIESMTTTAEVSLRNARLWLAELLPRWHASPSYSAVQTSGIAPVSRSESLSWVKRFTYDPAIAESEEFNAFLERHRRVARATGDSEALVKTFNNLANKAVRTGRGHLGLPLIEEARDWEPYNPRNWTVYARLLGEQGRRDEALDVLWRARHRFPWNVYCRNELGQLLRESGDLATAVSVYRESAASFPDNPVCRLGLGETLLDMGELEEARGVYEKAVGDIPTSHQLNRARGKLLVAIRNRDKAELEAVPQTRKPTIGREMAEMHHAERLGRAMVALREAERAAGDERSRLCGRALEYLEIPEEAIGEMLVGFVETRGLVLLARGDAGEARDYFVRQMEHYGRGGWIGVRLGLERARMKLGEPVSESFSDVPYGSQSARFILHVAQVIWLLEADAPESEVATRLRKIYQDAQQMRPGVALDSGPEDEAGIACAPRVARTRDAVGMIAALVNAKWFRPEGVNAPEDVEDTLRLPKIIARIRESEDDTLDSLSNAAVALAA